MLKILNTFQIITLHTVVIRSFYALIPTSNEYGTGYRKKINIQFFIYEQLAMSVLLQHGEHIVFIIWTHMF